MDWDCTACRKHKTTQQKRMNAIPGPNPRDHPNPLPWSLALDPGQTIVTAGTAEHQTIASSAYPDPTGRIKFVRRAAHQGRVYSPFGGTSRCIRRYRPNAAPRNLEAYRRWVEERSGSLPNGQKYFLLNKLSDMRPSEIAEMEGMKDGSSVRGLIIRVSDQLSAGELRLWEVEPEEAEAAKARLDAQRDKRRERYKLQKS